MAPGPPGLSEGQQRAGIVAATEGVADQGQHRRIAQRLRQGSVGVVAEAVDQLPPSWRRRIELDSGQEADLVRGVDARQDDLRRALQQARPGGRGRLAGPGEEDETEDGLLAERLQCRLPQVDLEQVEVVEDHHELARGQQSGGLGRAAPGPEHRVEVPELADEPVVDPHGVWIPAVQAEQHRHRDQRAVPVRYPLALVQDGQEQQHRDRALARSGVAGDDESPRRQAGVQVQQFPHLAVPRPYLPRLPGARAAVRSDGSRWRTAGRAPGAWWPTAAASDRAGARPRTLRVSTVP